MCNSIHIVFRNVKKKFPCKGPYCFKVKGQIHQCFLDLLPRNREYSLYRQLYFIDMMATTNCQLVCEENSELTVVVLIALQNISKPLCPS